MDSVQRVALVTGGGGELGGAIAHRLKVEGHRVVIGDKDGLTGGIASDAIHGVSPDSAASLYLDVRDLESIEAGLAEISERFGRVDVLVNNAGVMPTTGFEQIEIDEWDDVMNVNLRGAFLCARAVAAGMRARRWGRIINIASVAGQRGVGATGVHYRVSKAGLIGLTKALAIELAGSGVTVNAVAPGVIEGNAFRSLDEGLQGQVIASLPMGRPAEAYEVAAVCGFLASEDASYISGATFDVNGGSFMR